MAGLVGGALDALAGVKGVRVLGDREAVRGGSLISLAPVKKGFSVPDFNLFLNTALKGRLIAVRTGRHCADLACLNSGYSETIRLSFFAYNKPEDTELFVSALEKYLALL